MKEISIVYEKPDWIKKREKFLFDLFEKILFKGKSKYYLDYHYGGSKKKHFFSYYLVPLGKELSYYGHPEGTIRLSNHWSWYANIKKCADENLIQCELEGLPPKIRNNKSDKSTDPINMTSIAIMQNGIYKPLDVNLLKDLLSSL